MSKRGIWSVIAVVVIAMILGGGYYVFFYKQNFESSAEGTFLPEEYEEQYSVFKTTIDVNKTKFDQLLIEHRIDLRGGSLKYELYNPNGQLIEKGEVKAGAPFEKTLKVKPIKGEWMAKYYINKETDGHYVLKMKSS
ncbi:MULTISPECIES: hypothetical protein [Geobacillus]|uniref:DUF5590 domain-containing protein n=1 Tax=Geobacillus icigianus TaxID=1430331 RepID=A0ABU6BES3_9BACL|nr:hypothetical protein [Geobacillus icigianus]MEB3750428.1 hypothetical protein [Geobacillus icigianus]